MGRRSLKKRRPGAERGSDSRVIDEVSDESLDALTVENEDYGLFRKEDAVSPKARQSKSVRRPLAMISAARSREPGRSVATTATRSFSSPDFALRSRPNTAPRSLRGERWPLSRPVGTGEFYVSFALRTSVSLRRCLAGAAPRRASESVHRADENDLLVAYEELSARLLELNPVRRVTTLSF
jgi:hypothetical protein